MTIEIAKQERIGSSILFDGLLVEKKTLPKVNGEKYLLLTFQDKTGTITAPVWDNVDTADEILSENVVYTVAGALSEYNGQSQIKSPSVRMPEVELDPDYFYPPVEAYEIPEALFIEFKEMMNNLASPWRELCREAVLKRWGKFTTWVSAEKHHGNKKGGLFLHTYGALKTAEGILDTYVHNPFFEGYGNIKELNPDRLKAKVIFHDLMKMEEYEIAPIIRRKKDRRVDHLVDSVRLVHKTNDALDVLTEDEVDDFVYSILAHHGEYGAYKPKSLEDMLLHLVDMVDSRIVGSAEN